MTAVPSTASLVGRPFIVQVASVTRGVLRIHLTFHDFSWVMTRSRSFSRSFSKAAQIGVGLGLPSLVKVVSRMYCALARSAKVGVTVSTYRCPDSTLTFSPLRCDSHEDLNENEVF